MAKVSKSFRIEDSVLKKIDEILPCVQARFDYAADISMSNAKKANVTDVIEFAINFAYDRLKNEGEIK